MLVQLVVHGISLSGDVSIVASKNGSDEVDDGEWDGYCSGKCRCKEN